MPDSSTHVEIHKAKLRAIPDGSTGHPNPEWMHIPRKALRIIPIRKAYEAQNGIVASHITDTFYFHDPSGEEHVRKDVHLDLSSGTKTAPASTPPPSIAAGPAARCVTPDFNSSTLAITYADVIASALNLPAPPSLGDIARGFRSLVQRFRRAALIGALAIFTITQAVANSYKPEVMLGLHNFNASGGNTIYCALYTSSATLSASTTSYSATNEVSGTGYTAGGAALTNISPVLNSTAGCADFATITWSTSTITARGAELYNSTNSNRTILILNFGSDQTSTAGNFTITWPAQTMGNSVLQIA